MRVEKTFAPAYRIIACGLLLFFPNLTGLAQPLSDGPLVESFFAAIQENDTNTIFKMLDANTNLVQSLYAGRLPLHVAASMGRFEIVDQLLKHGADINAQNDTLDTGNAQLTALEAAIWHGHSNVCKLLLQTGANPDIQSSFEGGALHYAFANHRTDMIEWLLDYGANPFLEKDNPYNSATPLELCITLADGKLAARMLGQDQSHPVVIKFLHTPLRSQPWHRPQPAKTSADLVAEHGVAWLAAAAQRGELEAVQALLREGISAKTNAPGGYTLLQTFALGARAAEQSRTSVLGQWQQTRALLEETNARRDPGINPEFLASVRSQEAEQAAKGEATDPQRRMQLLQLCIKNGASYDAFAATALGDTNRAIELLSEDKAAARSRDCNGQTPLHWAVQTDRAPLVSFWIQSGAPLAATNAAGQTALHVAAANGKAEIVSILLAAKAPTDIADTNGWTPLDAAIQAKQSGTIHLLLGEKAPASHPERGLANSVHEAAASGNLAALGTLPETERNLETRNELGLTPLQVAVTKGHLAAAALLVDKGANVNARDPAGNSLLHQIFLRDIPTVHDLPPTNWLLRASRDPDKKTFNEYLVPPPVENTAEYEWISRHGWHQNELPQILCFLLACGIDVKATNNAGESVLQLLQEGKTSRDVFISIGERPLIMHLLIAHGSELDRRDAEGNTALHRLANDSGADENDRLAEIIAGGANVNATNFAGRTPLHKAAERIWGWDLSDPGTNQPFQRLVYSKVNVDAQDNEGFTPLHVLAMTHTSFKLKAIKLLLDAGANPDLRDKRGRTPTHLFLSGKWPWSEVSQGVRLLVKAGANLSAKDDAGKTPLHCLALTGATLDLDDEFIQANVDFQARDKNGNTPLHFAAKAGTRDCFDWLVKQGANLDATNNVGQTPRILARDNQRFF